jgi:hypothetical protein
MDPIPRRVKEAEQKISILYEIMRFVSSFLDVQLVLDAIVQLLCSEFKLDDCSIRLLDSEGKLRIRSQRGLSKECTEKLREKLAIDRYSENCFLTGFKSRTGAKDQRTDARVGRKDATVACSGTACHLQRDVATDSPRTQEFSYRRRGPCPKAPRENAR